MRQFDYPLFTLSNELTREQRSFFDQYGFIHFKNFIQPETVQSIIHETQKVQNHWLEKGIDKIYGVPLKFGTDINGEKIVQRFAFTSLFSPFLQELLKDPRLTSLFPLLGEEGGRIGEREKDGLVMNHYLNFAQSTFTKLGWHTDALRDIFYFKKIKPMLNVGLHLDKSESKNGGLRIIPGSHNQNLMSMLFRKRYFVDNKPDPEEIGLNTNPGDLTVHDGRLWHRVEKSKLTGEESRRRVMFIPIVSGPYEPKNENSKTVFYQRLMKLSK